MSDNFQDNIVYGNSTLAVSGDAIIVGSTDNGAKSIIFNNSGSQGHLAWQPSANHTINLPDANGTIQLTGQVPGAIYDGANSISSGTIRFTNANGVSFSINGQTISGSVAAQTNQTVGFYAVSNTTGASSSSTFDARSISFQGAGVASVGYSNGSVVISVPSGGGAGDGVNILAAGTQTANTTGTVMFSNSNGISFGMSNSSIITASVAAQTNQTVGLYALGNTTQNSSTTLDARSLSFNGLGAVSVGYSNGSVQISVPSAASVGFSNSNNVVFGSAGATTITASAFFNLSAGTTSNNLSAFTLSNSNGLSFGLNGSVVTGSYTVPTQTNQSVGLYALGNTTQNSSTTLDARSLSFNGLGAATVGYSNGSIQISVPNALTNINVSAGTTSNNLTNFVFSNSNNVSFGLNGSTITATVTTPAQTVQTVGLYALGNTTQNSSTTFDARTLSFNGLGAATVGYSNGSIQISVPTQTAQTQSNIQAFYDGANSISTGTIRFTNANGVSFSVNGQTISGSVAAQTVQTVGLYALGNTTQNSSTTLDARTLSFNGLGNITVGYSNGSIQISGAGGGGGSVNFSAGTTSNNLTAITFSNLNGVSFGLNGSTITGSVAAQTVQTVGLYAVSNTTGASSSTTIDARSLSFQGAGVASVGYTNGSVVISVPSGIANINVSAGTTSNNLTNFVFSNSNNVSFGLNGSTITATITVPSQTNQSVGLYALGNTTQNSSTTLDARSLSFNGLGAMTMGYSNGSIQVSAPATSSLSATGAVSISVNGSTISIGAPTQTVQTIGLYALGNTTQNSSTTLDARTLSFNGLGNISVGYSNGSIQISGSGGGGGVALSAGTNSTSTGTVVFSNSNGISFGMSANGVVTASVQAVAGSDIVFSNSNNIVFGKNVSTVTASALQPNLSQFDPFPYGPINTNSTIGQNSLYFIPFDLENYISAYRINFFYSLSTLISASATSSSGGYTFSAAIYARDSGANSTNITSQWSGSWGIRSTVSSNSQLNISFPVGILNSTAVSTNSTGLSTSNMSTFLVTSIAGFRAVPIPISSVMTPGRYWLAVANSTNAANGSYGITATVMQSSYSNNIAFRPFGVVSAASNANFYGIKDGLGTYSVTSNAFPGTVPMNSDTIRGGLTAILPYFNLSGYTTATNMI